MMRERRHYNCHHEMYVTALNMSSIFFRQEFARAASPSFRDNPHPFRSNHRGNNDREKCLAPVRPLNRVDHFDARRSGDRLFHPVEGNSIGRLRYRFPPSY
jgi:hypothetical protein